MYTRQLHVSSSSGDAVHGRCSIAHIIPSIFTGPLNIPQNAMRHMRRGCFNHYRSLHTFSQRLLPEVGCWNGFTNVQCISRNMANIFFYYNDYIICSCGFIAQWMKHVRNVMVELPYIIFNYEYTIADYTVAHLNGTAYSVKYYLYWVNHQPYKLLFYNSVDFPSSWQAYNNG